MTSRGLSAPAFGGIAFVWALALDLATKAFFVSHAHHLGVYLLYNARSVELTHGC